MRILTSATKNDAAIRCSMMLNLISKTGKLLWKTDWSVGNLKILRDIYHVLQVSALITLPSPFLILSKLPKGSRLVIFLFHSHVCSLQFMVWEPPSKQMSKLVLAMCQNSQLLPIVIAIVLPVLYVPFINIIMCLLIFLSALTGMWPTHPDSDNKFSASFLNHYCLFQ